MSTDNTEVEIETMQLQLPEEEHQTISQDEEAAPKLKHDASPEKQKFFVLPLSRVKHMMKIDPDGCDIFSNDSVVLVTKATELFLAYFSEQVAKKTLAAKRKTMNRQDVNSAITSIPQLCFLDGALE